MNANTIKPPTYLCEARMPNPLGFTRHTLELISGKYICLSGPPKGCGVKELVPHSLEETEEPGWSGKRGSRGTAAFGPRRCGDSGTKLTDRRIAWRVRQAQGDAQPRETVGQMAARWGVTPRWLRKLLQRWRQ